jgi:hypothetical protein
MNKPLKSCVNGCANPPHPPSYVLCKDCFTALVADVRMHQLLQRDDNIDNPDPPEVNR